MDQPSGARRDVYPIGKKNPNLPFHPAVRAGDFIFVSGQVAKDADGNMICRHDRGGDARHHRVDPPGARGSRARRSPTSCA